MAEALNSYFSSVFTSENTNTISDPSSALLIDDSIDITPDIVLSKITNLNSSKSPGPDGWPIQIIKAVGDPISIPLSTIFNKSFNSGTLSQDWKRAYATSIHKKGARNLISNSTLTAQTIIIWYTIHGNTLKWIKRFLSNRK